MQDDAAGPKGSGLSEGLGPGSEACPACGSDCNERDELAKAEREIERLSLEVTFLRSEVAFLRATMEGATHLLSKARIWGGMGWHYNPLHPMHYKPALDRMRQVLDRA